MIDVENVPIELLVLSGARLAMGTVIQNANVGFFGTVILRNNVGSGVVARLLEIECGVVGANVAFGPTQNTDSASGATAFLDGRVFGEGTALITQGNNNLLSPGSTFWVQGDDAGNSIKLRPPGGLAVITPGNAFQCGPTVANVAIRANFLWIERQAQPSELNL